MGIPKTGTVVRPDGVNDEFVFGPSCISRSNHNFPIGFCTIGRDGSSIVERHYQEPGHNGRPYAVIVYDKITASEEDLRGLDKFLKECEERVAAVA